jgi:predicted RNase H-like HicB family nuclease
MQYVCTAFVSKTDDGEYKLTFPEWKRIDVTGETFADAVHKGSIELNKAVGEKLNKSTTLPESDLEAEAPEGAERVFISVDALPSSVSLLLTASDASTILGVTRSRISNMLRAGILEEGHRDGRSTVITLNSVNERLLNPRRPGRPKKRSSSKEE